MDAMQGTRSTQFWAPFISEHLGELEDTERYSASSDFPGVLI